MNNFTLYRYKIVAFIFMTVGFVACKNDVEPQKKIVHNKESLYITISEKWVASTRRVNSQTRAFTQDWNEYNLLQDEISRKPLPTLGSLKQKATSIAQKIEKIMATTPGVFNNQDTRSRMAVLYSKAKMLETQIKQDYLKQDRIIQFTQELDYAFVLFQKQMERLVDRKKIQFEEGELEMRQQIQSDTLTQ